MDYQRLTETADKVKSEMDYFMKRLDDLKPEHLDKKYELNTLRIDYRYLYNLMRLYMIDSIRVQGILEDITETKNKQN